jgi:small subunit ribosomal protein S4e
MLDKLTGVFAPRPSAGPHKLRECVPMLIILRNRLKYALTYAEAKVIMNSRAIKVDGKIRTDMTYPCGFMDVISIEKTGENFRMLHDTKGRFILHRVTPKEAEFKLCRVKRLSTGAGKIPYVVTHDGRTIRYPDPLVKVRDTVKVDIATNKIIGFSKFEVGNVCVITGGKNIGRVGVIQVFPPSSLLPLLSPFASSLGGYKNIFYSAALTAFDAANITKTFWVCDTVQGKWRADDLVLYVCVRACMYAPA